MGRKGSGDTGVCVEYKGACSTQRAKTGSVNTSQSSVNKNGQKLVCQDSGHHGE